MVSFTGSAKVGWAIKERAGKNRVLLELGGNAAAIVELDCRRRSRTRSHRERWIWLMPVRVCIKVQRVFVHQSIAEAFTAALIERTRTVAVADPMDSATLCGPLIDEAAAERVRAWLDEAETRGAALRVGGHREGNG